MRDIPINGVPAFIDLRPRERTAKRGFVKRRNARYADCIGIIRRLRKHTAELLVDNASIKDWINKVTKPLVVNNQIIVGKSPVKLQKNEVMAIDDWGVDRSPEAVRTSLERFAHQACGIKYWYSKSGDLDWGKTREETRRRGVERYGEPNWRMPLMHEDGKLR